LIAEQNQHVCDSQACRRASGECSIRRGMDHVDHRESTASPTVPLWPHCQSEPIHAVSQFDDAEPTRRRLLDARSSAIVQTLGRRRHGRAARARSPRRRSGACISAAYAFQSAPRERRRCPYRVEAGLRPRRAASRWGPPSRSRLRLSTPPAPPAWPLAPVASGRSRSVSVYALEGGSGVVYGH
jgi:hypothetical protein